MDIEHGKFSKVLKGSMQTYSEVGFLWLLKVPLTARGEEDCFAWEFTHLWRVGTMATRRQLKAVLVDLSGTLHIEDSAVPGAQEALARLRHAPMTVRFVTNTTKESRRMLVERLRRLNFHIDEHEIFTSLSAARRQVERVGVRPLLLLDDRALEDFAGIETSDPNAVVVGLAPEHFNYQMLNKAFRLNKQIFLCAAIKNTDVAKTFFLEALQEVDCQPEEAVMIGDDARDDVGGAQNSGMLGILVKTGKYRPGDEAKINPPPHVICDSFPQAVDHILQHLL
ncbi:Haloacid dehalogenase-like hydrolase domain-containing protein 2-like [Arapaima gigas]